MHSVSLGVHGLPVRKPQVWFDESNAEVQLKKANVRFSDLSGKMKEDWLFEYVKLILEPINEDRYGTIH